METTEMKDRIAHIIRAQTLTAAEFALRLGIQPSNISHLLSGRNNPSLDFVKKLKETFPEYSLDWIIFGKGPMTVSEPFAPLPPVDHQTSVPVQDEKPLSEVEESIVFSQDNAPLPMVSQPHSGAVKQMIMVYEDHTFEVLLPR